jgi:hypothetical protein
MMTMLICIVFGWYGLAMGCHSVQAYRAGSSYQHAPLRAGQNVEAHEQALAAYKARANVLDQARKVYLPLSVANLLLSGLLVIAATRALGGRPGSRGLALQAVIANVVFTIADYWLMSPYRPKLVEAALLYFPPLGSTPKPLWPGDSVALRMSSVWTMYRLQLIAVLLTYGAALLALSMRATREYLAPVESKSDFDMDDA